MRAPQGMDSVARLACAALLLAACSDTVSPGDAGGDRPPADATPDAPADVAPDAPASPCPAAQPAAGSACSRDTLECEYGSDPRRECRTVATCSGSAWQIQTPSDGMARPWCASVPPAMCPAALEAASGQSCAAQGAVCTFGGLLCMCTNCMSFPVGRCDGTPVWQCDRQPMTAGCPTTPPRFGAMCAQEGLDCLYGCNSPDGAVACRGGVWQRGGFDMCPISTRRAKRDITYLTPAEVDALAAQVRATRLATYEYTVPAMAGRRRLGFILEDQPASFAADPERSQVDLYGFASLLAATAQSQDRELRALRRRVEGLERELAAARRSR